MQSSAASISGQQGAPSSAPVLEYVCLFTHDLKRKQKRWQDGRLKFHAFNKRIMVYDERGNFIGDTHWREDYEFGDGEEVQLERGGVIVQTAECTGSHSQDLSELIDKRVQEKVERQSAAAATRHTRPVPGGGRPAIPQAGTPHFQLRHAPLHNVLGTPTGHHGRAVVPTTSPFEERQRANAQQSSVPQDESPGPSKRRKRDPSPPSKSGYAQSLFGATLTLSGRPMSSAPLRHKPRSQQVYQHEQIPPSSSDVSDRNGDEDDVHEVFPPQKAPPLENGPLAERRPAVVNIPGSRTETLVGKNTRSKANVPSLLRQTEPQAAKSTYEPVRASVSRARKVNRFSDSRNDFEPVLDKDARAPQEQGTADDSALSELDSGRQPHSKVQSSQKATKERGRARISKESGVMHDMGDSVLLQRPSVVRKGVEAPAAQQALASEPHPPRHPTTEDRAPREPRIELRMAPSKKRGLLVLSEKGTKKKVRKSSKAKLADDSGYSGLSQTAMSDYEDGTKTDAGVRSRGGNNRASALEAEDHTSTLEKLPTQAPTTQPKHDPAEQTEAAPDVNGVIISSVGEPDQITQSRERNNNRQTHSGGIAGGDGRATEKCTNDKPVIIASPRKERHRGQDAGATYAQSKDALSRHGTREAHEKRLTSPKRQSGRACQYNADSTTTEESEIGDIASAQEVPQQRSNAPTKNTRDLEKDFDEIFSRRPENAPPPRLAQLSRKSVRSREVIGLFYEVEDGPPLQPKNGAMLQQRPSSANETYRNDNHLSEPGNIDGGTIAAQSAQLKQRRQDSLRGLPGSAIRQPISTSHPTNTKPPETIKPKQPQQQGLSDPKVPDALTETDPGLTKENMTDLISREPSPPLVFKEKEDPAVAQVLSSSEISAPARCNATGDTLQHDGNLEAHSDMEPVKTGSLQQESSRSILDLLSESHVPDSDVQKEAMNTMVLSRKPVPRIVNPATRGKKAARPSDAAGQVPENILPADDRALADVPKKPAKEAATVVAGFSKANGGPWSREAHDLFEYKRPG
ncbi:hypothetical protein SCUP515_10397 [Seiridium cupressi]